MAPGSKVEAMKKFLDGIENNADLKQRFLSRPLVTVSEALELPDDADQLDSDLANEVVLSVLRSPEKIALLHQVAAREAKGELDERSAKRETALLILEDAPDDLRDRLSALWGNQNPQETSFNPPVAIANLIVHVDVALVVTKAAILHEDVAFSGTIQDTLSTTHLQRVANAIARGR